MGQYNFEKETCDVCGRSKKDFKKNTNCLTYQEKMSYSFRLGVNGEVWCPECYKERNLKNLFNLMDKKEK